MLFFFVINILLILFKCLMRNYIYFYNIYLIFKDIIKFIKYDNFFLYVIFIKILFWIYVIMGFLNLCLCYCVSV